MAGDLVSIHFDRGTQSIHFTNHLDIASPGPAAACHHPKPRSIRAVGGTCDSAAPGRRPAAGRPNEIPRARCIFGIEIDPVSRADDRGFALHQAERLACKHHARHHRGRGHTTHQTHPTPSTPSTQARRTQRRLLGAAVVVCRAPPRSQRLHGRCWARRLPGGGGHISAAMACPRQWPLALALLLAAAASSQAALAAPRHPAVAAAPAGASLTFLSVRNLDAALYGVGQGEKMRSSKNLGHHFQPTRSRGPKSPLTDFLGSPKRTGAGR